MLPHYLWKVKVRICDKLHTRSTFSRSVMVSGRHLKAYSFPDLIFVYSGVKINGGYYRDMFCHSSCCPWCPKCQAISSSFNKTCSAPAHRARDILCNFLSSQHPLSFLKICGRRIAPTSIRSIVRYRVTSSNKCISCSCTALTNWRTVCSTLGMAWTERHWRCNWRRRPYKERVYMLQAKGGHFEQLL